MTALRVRIAERFDGLDQAWPSCADPGGALFYVFQSREFVETWLETIGAARKVQPLFVRVDGASGAPLLLLALAIEPRRGAQVLTFLDGGVADYNAPVLFPAADGVDPPTLWRELGRALPRVDAIAFDKMPAEVLGMPNPMCSSSPAAPSGYVIPLHGDWRTYQRTKLHRAKDSRRKRRRLAEAGGLRFIVAETDPERERLLSAMTQQKSRRYLERDGVDGFDRPGYRAFFPAMTERHGATCVHLSGLAAGGTLLAAHWGLVAGDRFYCHMLGYEAEGLGRYSPARLLIEDLICWSYERGLRAFDLGCGDAPWKALLGAQPMQLAHVSVPRTTFGWAYLSAHRLRRKLDRRLVQFAIDTAAREHAAT